MKSPRWRYDDGGRRACGFTGTAGDCVVRAIAIALDRPYSEVYEELRARMPKGESPRDGVKKRIWRTYLEERGWTFTPLMGIGTGCLTHVRASELPRRGRYILRLSRHLVALVDGEIRDTHDPSRGGTRCVYGYFARSES